MTIDARKSTIINKIRYVKEGWLLKSIEKLLSDVEVVEVSDVEESNAPDYSFYVGNIEPSLNLEKVKEERPVVKLDTQEFAAMADSVEWEQSVEQL